MLDLLVTVAGTILFWKLIGRPLHDWLESVKGIRFVSRDHVDEGHTPPGPDP